MTQPIQLAASFPSAALDSSVAAGEAPAAAPGGASFQDLLFQSLGQANVFERQAEEAVAGAITGDDLTQAEIFTAMKKADLALRTMLQIRNKLVEAYNELKNLRM